MTKINILTLVVFVISFIGILYLRDRPPVKYKVITPTRREAGYFKIEGNVDLVLGVVVMDKIDKAQAIELADYLVKKYKNRGKVIIKVHKYNKTIFDINWYGKISHIRATNNYSRYSLNELTDKNFIIDIFIEKKIPAITWFNEFNEYRKKEKTEDEKNLERLFREEILKNLKKIDDEKKKRK